jgi:hypothetical protein
MKKYRANISLTYTSIFEHVVIKETKKRIIYKIEHEFWDRDKIEIIERCENKFSDNHSWFNTFEEAKLFCVEKHIEKIKYFEKKIKHHNSEINKIVDLNKAIMSNMFGTKS